MFRIYVAFTAMVLVACGGQIATISENDAGNSDGEKVELYACSEPGTSCNAHDPCAINPICGEDLLCHPTSWQNCDDGLTCTDDICSGNGKCENTPKENYCALPIKKDEETVLECFQHNEQNPDDPCKVCNPNVDANKWSSATGGTCDDKNDCTKDDYCQEGECKGTDYSKECADNFVCTEDLCDGKGGCLGNPQKPGTCLIDSQCYQDGYVDAQGCNKCDSSKDPTNWTPVVADCLIDGVCYQSGDTDNTGCGICDPSQSKSSWTTTPNVCLIDGVCYNPGDTHPFGCATCDITKSTTSWTTVPNVCLIDGLCFNNGDTHPAGCGSCDITKSTTSWTTFSNKCLIDGVCYNNGDTHSTGCATCDITKSTIMWTPTLNNCVIMSGMANNTGGRILGYDIAVDNNENIYVTGIFHGQVAFGSITIPSFSTPSYDDKTFITKYDKNGKVLWAKMIDGYDTGSGQVINGGYGIAVDSTGNAYVTGFFKNNTTFGTTTLSPSLPYTWNMFITKLSPNGDFLWAKAPVGLGTTSGAGHAKDIAVDSIGNAYITGDFVLNLAFGTTTLFSPLITGDIFVAKLSPNGDFLWAASAGGSYADTGNGIAVDTTGNAYVTGDFMMQASFGTVSLSTNSSYNLFVAKYSPNGQLLNVNHANSTSTIMGNDIAVDTSGNTYVTGYFNGQATIGITTLTTNGASDIFVAKFSSNMQPILAYSVGGTGGDTGNGIAVDSTGNSYITGYKDGGVLLAKYSANGQSIWAYSAFDDGSGEASGNGIAIGPNNGLHVVGSFAKGISFGTTHPIQSVMATGQGLFVWKMTPP